MADLLRLTGALERFLAPEPRSPGRRVLLALGLALVYLGAAKVPFPSGLPFQAYLFWPAAAVARVERYYTDTMMFDRYRKVYEKALLGTKESG